MLWAGGVAEKGGKAFLGMGSIVLVDSVTSPVAVPLPTQVHEPFVNEDREKLG